MYCQNRIVHTIQSGDSLYKLSRQYKTTVTELILGNPGVNPYNLQVGMELTVCPGADYDGPGMGNGNTGMPGNMGGGNTGNVGGGTSGMPGTMGNGSNVGMPGNMSGSNAGMPGTMGSGNNAGMPGTMGSGTNAGMPGTMGSGSNAGMPGSVGGGTNAGMPGNMGGGNTGNVGGETSGMPGNMGGGNSAGMPGSMGGGTNAGMPENMGSGNTGTVGGGGTSGMPGNSADDNAVTMCRGVMELDQNMRLAWLSHVYWARMYLMSALSDSPDQQEVEERLLETADEIANVFADFLSNNATRQLRNLLTEHIEIAGEIIHALKAGNMENYDGLIKEWYSNANQIANLLGAQNPYFSGRETRNMLLKHLDLERESIEHQVNGEYSQSIETFRDIVDQAVQMADFFARGLLAR